MDEDAELNTASVSGFGDIGSVLGSTQASKTRTGPSFGDQTRQIPQRASTYEGSCKDMCDTCHPIGLVGEPSLQCSPGGGLRSDQRVPTDVCSPL